MSLENKFKWFNNYFQYLKERKSIKNDENITLRPMPSSDYYVYNQVFKEKEYKPVVDFFQSNEIECKRVIDAGGNIGLTSLYLNKYLKNAEYAIIEPDTNNFKILEKNAENNLDAEQYKLFHNALMHQSNLNIKINNDFRGGNDWSKSTELSQNESDIKSITIQDVVKNMNWDGVDLLKIDIEGSEDFLLKDDVNLDFFGYTKVIAIEIHDELDIRNQLYSLFRKNGFVLFDYDETTLAVNKKFIQ